ncbi:MAG: YitT family protein [Sphaerochaetaceae bacterium]
MRKTRRIVKEALLIIIGSAVAAFGIAAFNMPAKIASGGVNGIATILYHSFGFEPGIAMLCMNVPLFVIGVKTFGRTYGIKSLAGIILLSFFVSTIGKIIGYEGIIASDDSMGVLLSGLFGGFFLGAGIGLVMKSGANTGGTDIIGQIISKKTPLALGTSLLLVDAMIILTSAFVFGIERAMFAIITVYVSTQMINYVIMVMGTKYAKTVFIFSDRLDEIKKLVIYDIGHGGTIFNGEGIYTGNKRQMLMAVVPNQLISRLTVLVHETDPKAFMVVEEAYKVLGEGFTPIADEAVDHLGSPKKSPSQAALSAPSALKGKASRQKRRTV